MLANWRRIVFAVSAAVSSLLLVYIVYVHVLSATRMAAGPPQDFRESFGTSDGLPPGYDVRKRGGLGWTSRGGVLAVEGAGHAGDELVVTSAARRFDDSVMMVRFRSRSSEPLEVFVGLEAKDGRAVSAAYVVAPTSFVHIGGDISGPFRSGQAVEDVRIDGGAADDWHTLAFQIAPRYSTAAALLDGKPIVSTAVLWPQAVDSRISIGVRLRGDVAHANVEIDALTMQTLDEVASSFDDTFNGEILDSQRWIVQYPDLNIATLDLRLAKGKGLTLEGRAVGIVGEHTPFYFVRTPPFALRSFHAKADFTVDAMKEARVFFGIIGSSSWTSMDKLFDVAVFERSGKSLIDDTGAWNGNGEISFDLGPEITFPRRFALEVDYDAKTGFATALVDDTVIGKHRLDLKPLDLVSLRLGSGGYAIGALSKVAVHRISLEMR
jgi:hypothetical protein